MKTAQQEHERNAALQAFAELASHFSDQGLRTLTRAADENRLIRGHWQKTRNLRLGCPLSCADGVLGGATAGRFFWQAEARNAFVNAWDRGLFSPADVAGIARAEMVWREAHPARLANTGARLGGWARALFAPLRLARRFATP